MKATLFCLAFAACGAMASQASRFAERDVIFRNGAVDLHGTLMLPAVQGPWPAVVFLHGSGPHPRAGFRPYAEEFARLGVASLFFDKRGSGESGGSWTTSSLDDLVGDALAAVDRLGREAGVDPGRIGLWGVSQAGWIGPRVFARAPDTVAFMILISGGGVSPRESELYSYRMAFDDAGLSEAERSEGFDILDAYFQYLATGDGRPELVERLDALEADRGNRLSRLATQLGRVLPSLENRPNWSWVAAYDPVADIARVTCPLLLMFGDLDREQPTELAVLRWREGLERAGNDNVTLMIFPGAGHGIRQGDAHGGADRRAFADGYQEAILGWLWRHVVRRPPPDDTVPVAGGSFRMGAAEHLIAGLRSRYGVSFPGSFENEIPGHAVTVGTLHMDRYEVTNERFAEFIASHPDWATGE